MRILTMSRFFPKGHIREGEATFFMEKILAGLGVTMKTLPDHLSSIVNDFQMLLAPEETKHHTIRAGDRWKPGDMVSLRVWSDKPRRSKQIEFAQVEVVKTWEVEIYTQGRDIKINGEVCDFDLAKAVAKNDGLEWADFVSWFAIHPKKKGAEFRGQIVCWSQYVNY